VKLDRIPRRDDPQRVPAPVPGEPGLFVVDGSWGEIAPIQLTPGVKTVGELEVIEHLSNGGRIVDTRQPDLHAKGSIPGAVGIRHQEIVERLGAVEEPIVLFCNGPQCAATPQAIQALLDSGVRAELLLYYRGGMHDWVTLGLPVDPPLS
jgi:rhodanese-related sulfurtransferase